MISPCTLRVYLFVLSLAYILLPHSSSYFISHSNCLFILCSRSCLCSYCIIQVVIDLIHLFLFELIVPGLIIIIISTYNLNDIVKATEYIHTGKSNLYFIWVFHLLCENLKSLFQYSKDSFNCVPDAWVLSPVSPDDRSQRFIGLEMRI